MTDTFIFNAPVTDPEVAYLADIFRKARDARRNFYDRWLRNYKLAQNQQGSQLSSTWYPNPRDSEIFPILSSIVAWMTDQNIVIDLTPAADPHSPFYSFISQVCNDLSAVIYSTWLSEGYRSEAKLVIWDALQFGVGIFKSVWDNSVAGGYGNALLKRVDPWSFYLDPGATSLSDAEYMIEVRRVSEDELERRFPDTYMRAVDSGYAGSDVQADERPNQYTAAAAGILNTVNPSSVGGGQMRWAKSRMRGNSDTSSSIVLYEYWLLENEEVEDDYNDIAEEDRPQVAERHFRPSWRVVCMANGQILLDEKAVDLWSHGEHPYTRFTFDDLGEFYGVALVDHLAHPQTYINRLLTQLQHNAELVGNPIFMEASNSGLDRVSIINKPGQRLRVTGPGAMQNKPEWMRPPDMPKFVMDLVTFWIQRMENISGLGPAQKGQTPGGRNAQSTMSSIQEAAFVRIRAAQYNLERAYEQAVSKIADLIIDNYTEPRFIAVTGKGGERSSLALNARHFEVPTEEGASPLKYSIQLMAGATAPTSRQARIAEARDLFVLGAIDDRGVLEAYQYPNIEQLLERKYKKQAMGVSQSPGARQRSVKS